MDNVKLPQYLRHLPPEGKTLDHECVLGLTCDKPVTHIPCKIQVSFTVEDFPAQSADLSSPVLLLVYLASAHAAQRLTSDQVFVGQSLPAASRQLSLRPTHSLRNIYDLNNISARLLYTECKFGLIVSIYH